MAEKAIGDKTNKHKKKKTIDGQRNSIDWNLVYGFIMETSRN